MSRLALINMVIGFVIVFISASLGTFIVNTMTELYVTAPQHLAAWQHTLARSAHGHSTLCGLVHILFALTLPYSRLSARFKLWQSLGILAGSIAMGPLLLWKSLIPPTLELDLLSVVMGLLLSLFLFAIIFHAFGIFLRIRRA